jgi:uncharacterized protein (DUF305 family)
VAVLMMRSLVRDDDGAFVVVAALTGADFDARWLAMMIEHHRGAIEMSETVLTEGANGDVLSLAQQIIDAQQGEITEMESLLA